MARHVSWNGVFPAVTTQFREDFSLDIEATQRVIEGLLRDGVSGLIVCGTVGENCSLTRAEKIAVMEAAKEVARGPRAHPGRHRRIHHRFRHRDRARGRAGRHRRDHGDARSGLFLQGP